MSSLAYDVVLLPSAQLGTKALAASKTLEPLGTHFTLGQDTNCPHISLYMLQLKAIDLPQVKSLLSEIAATSQILALTAERYFQTNNFFDVEYRKINKLVDLQNRVVSDLNPIRDGMREKDKERMAEATGVSLDNYTKYGWNTIGELFRPHLTITRFINEQANPEQKLLDLSEFSGQFAKLGLFEMGANGTAARKIDDWALL